MVEPDRARHGRGPNGGRGDFCREACDLVVSARPGQDDGINLTEVAAALAVLAGIAAADAACCHRLGVRSRGQDHARAIELVKQVVPHGDDLARGLDRLLDLKGNAHNGIPGVSEGDARRAVEWARRAIDHTRAELRS